MGYAAFISYTHKDEAVARRLQRRLESFRLPRGIDPALKSRLKPIFRDVTELTAHHSLTDVIRDAITQSRFLIVVCSPNAQKSRWVNEEIRLFRSIHGDAAILPIIVDGTPQTAFPEALTENGVEPIAADMTRKKGGFQRARLQLAAPILGVTLDSLIRRDAIRRKRASAIITGASLTLSVIMAGMTWLAIDGNRRAQTSRNEAESLIEYMIKDLRAELEPLGRLEILNGVGDRVTNYYDAIPRAQMDDDRLLRLARTQHLLGQVYLDERELKKARRVLSEAYDITLMNLSDKPNDSFSIFNHAQSEFWLGMLYSKTGVNDQALPYWAKYKDLSFDLHARQPENFDWTLEAAHAANNLGYLHGRLGDEASREANLNEAVELYEAALRIRPNDYEASVSLGNAISGLVNFQVDAGEYDKALATTSRQIELLRILSQDHPNDKKLDYHSALNHVRYQKIIFAASNHCQVSEFEAALGRLYELSKHDPDNTNWALNYVHYYIDFLNDCRADMSADNYAAHFGSLKEAAAPFLPDARIEKKINGLSKSH